MTDLREEIAGMAEPAEVRATAELLGAAGAPSSEDRLLAFLRRFLSGPPSVGPDGKIPIDALAEAIAARAWTDALWEETMRLIDDTIDPNELRLLEAVRGRLSGRRT